MNTLAIIAFKAHLATASGRQSTCPFHPNSKEAKAWHTGAWSGYVAHEKVKNPMFTL